MDATENQEKRTNDWANLIFGAALFGAPWLYNYAGVTRVAVTAWATGAVVMLMALAAILRFAEWEEWVELVLGIWIFASPFVLSFTNVELAVQVHVIIGVLLVISSGLRLWRLHHPPVVIDAR